MAEKGGVVCAQLDVMLASSGVVGWSTVSAASRMSLEEASLGSKGGFGFCDDAWRVRVMVFNPTATKDEISGVGGTRDSVAVSAASLFESWCLRFLLLLPSDLAMWLVRCCPMGESSLADIKLSTSSSWREDKASLPAQKLKDGFLVL